MIINNVKDIIESGSLVKLTEKELQFLAENINDSSANQPPDNYNVYGKGIVSGDSSSFRFYNPIISTQRSGGNRIIGFSWKPFSGGELPDVRGPGSEKNRASISENTTSAAIDMAKNGSISKREAIAIIRARIGLEQAQFPYQIQKEPYKNEDLQRPTGFNSYGDTPYPGTNFNGSSEVAETTLKDHISSLLRSYGHKKTLNAFYNEVQEKISNGTWKITFCTNGKMIIYEMVDNPYYNQHQIGTPQQDRDLDGKIDSSEDFFELKNDPTWIPVKLKKPISFNFSSFDSLSDEEKGLDSFYLDLINSGRNIDGTKLPTSPSDISNESFQNLFGRPKPKGIIAERSSLGDAAYGSKNYVYGGFFAILFGAKLLQSFGPRVPFVGSMIAKHAPGGTFSQELLEKFLTSTEHNLTNFKLAKDIVTLDPLRLVRDYGVSKLAHFIEEIIGSGAVFRGIPWVGWVLAGTVVAYDIFFADAVSAGIDEGEKRRRYVRALRSQNTDFNTSGPNFPPEADAQFAGFKDLRPGQARDPGIAIFDPKCVVPIEINENGEPPDAPIGIVTDPDGNPIIDQRTKRPILKFPKKIIPRTNAPGIQNYGPSDEAGIQENIEDYDIKDRLAKNADAENKSDQDYKPQSSIELPMNEQPESYDGTNEYTLGRDDDLNNPFPDEITGDVSPNGLPRNILTEFYVIQPERPIYYIYGERFIYPNGGSSGQSTNASPPRSSTTINSPLNNPLGG
jgi:hypothetical protein